MSLAPALFCRIRSIRPDHTSTFKGAARVCQQDSNLCTRLRRPWGLTEFSQLIDVWWASLPGTGLQMVQRVCAVGFWTACRSWTSVGWETSAAVTESGAQSCEGLLRWVWLADRRHVADTTSLRETQVTRKLAGLLSPCCADANWLRANLEEVNLGTLVTERGMIVYQVGQWTRQGA